MLKKENFTLEHILELKENKAVDNFILERSIYAFGLLEALCRVDMPFIFKGGTSLSKAYGLIERFSEDIDLIIDWETLNYSQNDT